MDSKTVNMKKKRIPLSVTNTENLETLKYHIFVDKTLVRSIICDKCGNNDEKIFKEEHSIEILKILDLTNMDE